MARREDPEPSRWRGATTWITLTSAFRGGAVIGLGVWVAILQRDHESEGTLPAARIAELERIEAELEQQVPELERLVSDLQERLEAEQVAAEESRNQHDAAREEVERLSEELGVKGREFSDIQGELEQLAAQAEADVAAANDATASARDRAAAQRARADLAESCLGAVAEVLRTVYASEHPEKTLGQAADELNAIAKDCAPPE